MRIRSVGLVGAGVVGVVFGGLYLAGLAVGDDELAPGTEVRGVALGGLGVAEAGAVLERRQGEFWPDEVHVRVGATEDVVGTAAAGYALDARATAERAARSGNDPVTVIGRLFADGDRDVAPVVRLDEARARAALGAVAAKHDRAARDGGITFEGGRPVPVAPRRGQSLDIGAALAALRGTDPTGEAPAVPLPVRHAEPEVGAAEVDRALKAFARPAMSAPVTLTTTGGGRLALTPAVVGAHLSMTRGSGDRLTPHLDARGLLDDPAVARRLEQITDEAVDARLALDGGRVVVTADGRSGREVTPGALRGAVLPLLTATGAARTGPVATREIRPTLTRDNVDELGITEQMSTFTVNFPAAPYRTKNVGRAAELIDGSVVLPGDTWSFNRTVGERTEANGFVEGVIIQDGQFARATGGGVSAVATTVFNAVFFAGVKPLEWGAHSFYIERYPEGREATVVWGALDLSFLNDSGNAVYIRTRATEGSITVSFLGTRKYDDVQSVKGPRTNVKEPATREGPVLKCEPQTPLEGFDVTVERVFVERGQEVRRERFGTHYTPRDEVVCD
ncbi:VanW family protein [Streptomyces sp. NPDC051940]|uniref:VanW family protein n=1 Tax=Streptomyces sp. NPDC051940 TaxID=3155675 RepID=UPI00341E463D